MGFLDFLKSAPPHHDPHLGVLEWSGKSWEGSITLEEGCEIPLRLPGKRAGPDETALALARELPGKFEGLLPALEKALFEHYEPSRDTAESGEGGVFAPFPSLASAADVWAHVTPQGVLVDPLGGVLTIEIALEVGWDEEHTLGARIRDWVLVELCGSIRSGF